VSTRWFSLGFETERQPAKRGRYKRGRTCLATAGEKPPAIDIAGPGVSRFARLPFPAQARSPSIFTDGTRNLTLVFWDVNSGQPCFGAGCTQFELQQKSTYFRFGDCARCYKNLPITCLILVQGNSVPLRRCRGLCPYHHDK